GGEGGGQGTEPRREGGGDLAAGAGADEQPRGAIVEQRLENRGGGHRDRREIDEHGRARREIVQRSAPALRGDEWARAAGCRVQRPRQEGPTCGGRRLEPDGQEKRCGLTGERDAL